MQQAIQTLSREDYLALETQSHEKHEYYHGEIYAMAGGTFNHAAVAGNIYSRLKQKLHGKPCRPMNSDMRVQTPSGLHTYPDVSVYCGDAELTDNQSTLLNVTVIFEVLSPSTRDYDRGDKFALYRSIQGLQDYILVDPDCVFVEHFHQLKKGQWLLQEYTQIDNTLILNSLSIELNLNDIYEDIIFDAQN